MLFLIYSGVFTSVIMEVMTSTCVSHLFIIGCYSVSAPITLGLVSIDSANPSTVLMLFNEQWSSLKFMCRATLHPFEYRYLYLPLYYFCIYRWVQFLIRDQISLYFKSFIYYIFCFL